MQDTATFSELLDRLSAAGRRQSLWTLGKLEDAPADTVSRIEETLRQYGIDRIAGETLGGNMSIAAEIPGRNAVLRISDAAVEPPRPDHPSILQPLATPRTVENFRIEIMPKATTLQDALDGGLISKAEVREQLDGMFRSFERSGLFFWDCKMADMGVVPGEDGTPKLVVLDGGAVCPESERFEGRIGKDTKTNHDKYVVNRAFLEEQLSVEAHAPDQVLYHGSCAGISGPLTPRMQSGNVNGEFPDGPRELVFATNDKSAAELYSLKTPHMLSVTSTDGQHIGLFTDYDSWSRAIGNAPCTLYTLPRESFTNVVHDHSGQPSYEWMSETSVSPIGRQRVTPQAVMESGTQLVFLDKRIGKGEWHAFGKRIRPKLESLQGRDFSGAHLIRELQDAGLVECHLNREQGINPVELPKHTHVSQLLREDISDLKRQVAAKQVEAIRSDLGRIRPPGIIYPSSPEEALKNARQFRADGGEHAR